ncbi:MAG TPA: hypothetical protein VGR62_06710 [Candidatus Binatia bacterium]|jgi:hypothetical protein|nr:hypothetical protein [Candidatus Binatia bacterium]
MDARITLLAVMVAYAATGVPGVCASPFSARETERGMRIDRADGTTEVLEANGEFQRPGEPALVYRVGGETVAGVWRTGSDAVAVRRGSTEDGPLLGRIVTSWTDDEIILSIEPAGGVAMRTSPFARASAGGPTSALDRDIATREALAGTYRATFLTGDGESGWLSLDVDRDGVTTWTGDVPAAISPALAAAAAAVVVGEVDLISRSISAAAPRRR